MLDSEGSPGHQSGKRQRQVSRRAEKKYILFNLIYVQALCKLL